MEKYTNDLVSIIIPTRGDRDISSTLTSVKNQTYKNFEIIQITDKDKKGAPWARNQGEKEAKGEFLLFLDDDIILNKRFLEEMLAALEKNPKASYAYCHYERKGMFNDISKAYPFDEERLKKWNYISTMSLLRHLDFIAWDEKIKRFQDWDLWLTLLDAGKTGVLVDKVLFSAPYTDKGITNLDEKEIIRLANRVRIKHGMVAYVVREKTKDILRPFYHGAKRVIGKK
jgi:glycosyltransferase involved in cell wall biosynthesis